MIIEREEVARQMGQPVRCEEEKKRLGNLLLKSSLGAKINEAGKPIICICRLFDIQVFFQVMPLENSMETPKHFVGICGVLNKGMSGVTLIYIFLGFFGYLKYGEACSGSITLNLPIDE